MMLSLSAVRVICICVLWLASSQHFTFVVEELEKGMMKKKKAEHEGNNEGKMRFFIELSPKLH